MEEIVKNILKEYPNIQYRIHSKFDIPFFGYVVFDDEEFELFRYIIVDKVIYVVKGIGSNSTMVKFAEKDFKTNAKLVDFIMDTIGDRLRQLQKRSWESKRNKMIDTLNKLNKLNKKDVV